jgi:hypothetical protein
MKEKQDTICAAVYWDAINSYEDVTLTSQLHIQLSINEPIRLDSAMKIWHCPVT